MYRVYYLTITSVSQVQQLSFCDLSQQKLEIKNVVIFIRTWALGQVRLEKPAKLKFLSVLTSIDDGQKKEERKLEREEVGGWKMGSGGMRGAVVTSSVLN